MNSTTRKLVFASVICVLMSCSRGQGNSSNAAPPPAAKNATNVPAYELALPAYLRAKVGQPFKGDLDSMITRRLIRVAAPFNRTYFFLDGAVERGLSYEYLKLYEDKLNESLGKAHPKIYVILLPIPRDQLLSQLNAGKVDMVVAQLTVTPERSRLVDFSIPTRKDVDEILVTGPGSKPVSTISDLAGRTIFARHSSSYFQSIQQLNNKLRSEGKKAIDVEAAPENLEDDDLLEMVNAGLLPATVVDNYLAEFWKKIFPNLVLSEQAPLRTGGEIAVAFRKGSPKLAASLNEFIGKYGLETAMGAVLNQKYLQNAKYVKDAASDNERKKFLATVDLFRKYGQEYSFDYLMMAAQGYQESRLDQNARSHVGAVGVMQLMPRTGEEQAVGDIHQVDPNVHAGVKYMAAIKGRYFADNSIDEINKELFSFASYNAGPGRVRQLRKEAEARGLNPNVWFGNVEQIASEKIGAETTTYVSNIFKYYIAYKLITEEQRRRESTKKAIAQKSSQG